MPDDLESRLIEIENSLIRLHGQITDLETENEFLKEIVKSLYEQSKLNKDKLYEYRHRTSNTGN